MYDYVFEWDVQKAIANYEKHGVSFEEAATIFADPDGLDGEDSDHSQHEQRRQRIAVSIAGRILFVIYTLRRTGHEKRETIRIISARQASRKERKAYSRLSH
ncbi:MAG: BrnT family toxin [Nitrospira sp.]|nr:BrnT family toxin [Nitrospira sp.]